MIPAELTASVARRRARPAIAVDAARAARPSRWRAFARPGEAPGGRRPAALRRVERQGLPGRRARRDGRGERARAARCGSPSISPAPDLDDAIAAVGHMPLPPYIAGRRAEDAADRADYQTVFAARGRRGRGADRGPAFHRGAASRALDARGIAPPLRDAARRRRHLPAGEEPRTPPGTACTPSGAGLRRDGRGAERGARARRPHRRGRHDVAAPPRKRGGRRTGRSGPSRARRIFITPGYRFRAVDLLMTNFHLPRSTLFMLVAAFAGLETMRGLRPRHRERLPLLLLRRRLPAHPEAP